MAHAKTVRSTLLLSLLLIFAPLLTLTAHASQHAIAMFGTPKYSVEFTHFDYVNPDAPKGGSVKLAALGTFDSFNQFIVKGTSADGLGIIYDSLLKRSDDEPFTLYGRLATEIELAEDRSWVRFILNPAAKFSDQHPVTAEDVVFTFELLKTQGSPFYKTYYGDVVSITADSPYEVTFKFKGENAELPLIVGEAPILPKHYWAERDFSAVSLEIPLGSGPYLIESFEPGRSVTFKRNPDYWGADLAVNKGQYNFDQIRYDYYRDSAVQLEAFKAGEYDYRTENSSKQWATGYDGEALASGQIIKELIPHKRPTGMQAFVMNTRRAPFDQLPVRAALEKLFDFEWTNRNIFYNAYTRTQSFFSNSDMAATELPSAAEIQLLKSLQAPVPTEVLTKVYTPTQTDGSGNIRNQVRQALRLMKQAGWNLKQGQLLNAEGQPFEFEILLVQPSMERVVSPFIKNLERAGIKTRIRIVDVPQYITRLNEFDFDMIIGSFPQSLSPGNEQRDFWHSSVAQMPGTRNLIGINNPAVDELVERLISAKSRDELVTTTRALDRVLQWNHYVIPQFHIRADRVAYWDKFGKPNTRPEYDLGFDTWWIRPAVQ